MVIKEELMVVAHFEQHGWARVPQGCIQTWFKNLLDDNGIPYEIAHDGETFIAL